GQDAPCQGPRPLHRLLLSAHPVHAGPAADRRHRRQRLQPGARRFRVQARRDLREHRARRRDQPASPKTQSALLECMEERQVTVDTVTYQLGMPFMVIATQNPIEHEGTYPLPEAQLDRFMLRIHIGYPGVEAELGILATHGYHSTLDE